MYIANESMLEDRLRKLTQERRELNLLIKKRKQRKERQDKSEHERLQKQEEEYQLLLAINAVNASGVSNSLQHSCFPFKYVIRNRPDSQVSFLSVECSCYVELTKATTEEAEVSVKRNQPESAQYGYGEVDEHVDLINKRIQDKIKKAAKYTVNSSKLVLLIYTSSYLNPLDDELGDPDKLREVLLENRKSVEFKDVIIHAGQYFYQNYSTTLDFFKDPFA